MIFIFKRLKFVRCKNAKIGAMCGACKECENRLWFNWKYLFIHSMLYIVPFFCLYYIAGRRGTTVIIAVLFVTHIFIDTGACYFIKKMKQIVVFVLDQTLHIGILYMAFPLLNLNCNIDIHYKTLKVIFLDLMLIMPCSIIINKLIQDIYPDSEEIEMFDVGSMIGVMERILTVIFACFDNFPAIAIIITVKTWARTNDLKETEFRNKYSLGTLSSLVLALLVFLIYKSI